MPFIHIQIEPIKSFLKGLYPKKRVFHLLLWITIFLIINPLDNHGQNTKITLQEIWDSKNPNEKKYAIPNTATDSITAKKSLATLIRTLQSDGYLLANIDSITLPKPNYWKVYIHSGALFQWGKLTQGNIPDNLLSKIGYKERFYQQKTIKPTDWNNLSSKLLTYLQNHGYPFASVQLTDIQQEQRIIQASINYQPGPLILFDSLHIKGEVALNKKFLAKLIGWEKELPYNEQQAQLAIQKLQSLSYLKVTASPKITFGNGKAVLYLEAETTKTTQLDGILGVQFNQDPITQIRKPVLTGQINLRLQNPFGKGKKLELAFQRVKTASQTFHLTYTHPNLLNTNFDASIDFKFLKEDSTFTNINRTLQVKYNARQRGQISFLADFFDSRLTTTFDASEVQQYRNFTSNSFTSYGLQWDWQQTDQPILPLKGIRIQSTFKVGNKNIRPALATTDPNYTTIYGDTPLKTIQFISEVTIDKFWQFGKSSSLLTRLQTGSIFNENLFQNDLFRLGGLQTLRGFDENTFFASDYAIFLGEQRFFLNQRSYISLFYNQGFIQNRVADFQQSDFPLGFGFGMTFQTKAGIFSLIYALGKSEEQSVDFRFSKIHFGLRSIL